MKNVVTVMALLVGVMGLVGCDDLVTPKGVVNTAAEALYKNDLAKLQKTLKGPAAAQFGTKAGLVTLRQKLSGKKGLRIEDAVFVKSTPVRNGAQIAVRTY